jgi:hypothetical protein
LLVEIGVRWQLGLVESQCLKVDERVKGVSHGEWVVSFFEIVPWRGIKL